MHNLYAVTGYPDPPGTMEEEEEEDDYENSTPPYKDLPPKPGTMEEEEEDDDYENSTPPYKDLPPKPGSSAPPRPPRAEKETEKPPIPCKPRNMTGLDLVSVTCPPPQPAVNLEPSPLQPSLAVTGMSGLAGLKHDIDRVRADTNQSLVELRGLLGCRRVTCPEGWLPFEGKCYYFSPITKSWDEARIFCQENYSHLVIINSFAEHNFVAKAHGSPRVHWLGLNDRGQEGDWRWLDGSPVTLSFWEPEEPNNIHNEDCAAMNKDGTWNDLSCYKTTYWICERKCSC
ncbi:C-type lectin domain family 17, member A isoform X4 [Macaca thibetana thibetana]|uniref:C-type lectin domain family 17, member A isoform X4 n=1 Tax=Macaca thibetana thibetana TaxID=257877 RepID=UPI0021BC396F|nr:C-type lectin domain family 17, member A isoform X4 [Macaca thibetana thibetana]